MYMNTMNSSRFKVDMRVCIAAGVHGAGRCGSVAGNEVFIEQWWCPVLWDDADGPDFSKSYCLEPIGGMEPEDWRELLHVLTAPDNPAGMRQDRLMAIVGKIGSGNGDKLDTDELDEIRRSLTSTHVSAHSSVARLRTISGKIGPGSSWKPKLRLPCVEDVLARLYVDEDGGRVCAAVAKLCDKELDRSGGLLGRVRDRATALTAMTNPSVAVTP